jgi:hypothetical protein
MSDLTLTAPVFLKPVYQTTASGVKLSQLASKTPNSAIFADPSWSIYGKPESKMLAAASASIAIQIENAIRILRESKIKISRLADVRSYLAAYAGLVDPLLYACQKTLEILSPEDDLVLSVYHDPEGASEYLLVEIRKATYPDDIYDQIEAIRETYRPMLDNKQGWLIVSTDFAFPTRA